MKSVMETLEAWLYDPFIERRYIVVVFLIGFCGAMLSTGLIAIRLPGWGWWRIPTALGVLAVTLLAAYRIVKAGVDAAEIKQRAISQAKGVWFPRNN